MVTDEPWNNLNRIMDTRIRGIAPVSLIELLLLDYKVNHWRNRNLILTKVYQELVGVFYFVIH